MDRVVVIGCAGSGKSTLARRLARVTGLPLIERDGLPTEGTPEFLEAAETVVSGTTWIFDGHPYFAESLVFGSADTVIFLDYPRAL